MTSTPVVVADTSPINYLILIGHVAVLPALGFRVAGTLAILGMAARRDLLSLPDAIDRLKQTSFHYSQEILEQFLAEQGGKA